MSEDALAVRNLGKCYADHHVLRGLNLTVQKGEIAAVLGENGAGKSTLVKILAGAVKPDAGETWIDGTQVALTSPRAALRRGIAIIPQELTYVPDLTVAENLCLGNWPSKGALTSLAAVNRSAETAAAEFGFDLRLRAKMRNLSAADQQLVEILKALTRGSRLILLDEPTAALSASDSERLFRHLRVLARQGVALIYISHRIDEVFQLCETAHVLRNGELVLSAPIDEISSEQVIEAMLGRPHNEAAVLKRTEDRDEVGIELVGWQHEGHPKLNDINLSVKVGEIVGLYGLRGGGTELIAETLGGMATHVTGRTVVEGKSITSMRNPRHARKLGIAHLPAERKTQGLVLSLNVQKQMTLMVMDRVSRFGMIRPRVERQLANGLGKATHLRARSLGQGLRELSGGNQQKVLIGSRIATEPAVLVLQEPTRGVDVGARLEIHQLLRDLADDGATILLVTSDIEETVTLSDRVLVVRNGTVVLEVTSPSLEHRNLVVQAAGGMEA